MRNTFKRDLSFGGFSCSSNISGSRSTVSSFISGSSNTVSGFFFGMFSELRDFKPLDKQIEETVELMPSAAIHSNDLSATFIMSTVVV